MSHKLIILLIANEMCLAVIFIICSHITSEVVCVPSKWGETRQESYMYTPHLDTAKSGISHCRTLKM